MATMKLQVPTLDPLETRGMRRNCEPLTWHWTPSSLELKRGLEIIEDLPPDEFALLFGKAWPGG